MLFNYLFVFLGSFLVGLIVINILKKFSLNYTWLTLKGTPLIGGLGMGLSFIIISLLSLLMNRGLSRELIAIISTASIMLVFGLIDDWRELSVVAKFLVQILAASLLIFFGIRTQIVYIGNLPNIIITLIWILAITNAFNHLDVMDGVTAGVSVIISIAFFIISFLNGDIGSQILSLALIGSTLGFLTYNLPPAQIYMGNSGSHFLGFAQAAIALAISYAPMERKVALFSPLLILGFPIFDTAFLILVRLSKKKMPFKKSNDHMVLRFLALGYSKNKTLMIMLYWSSFFALCGIMVSQFSNVLGIITISIAVLASLVLARRMFRVVVND